MGRGIGPSRQEDMKVLYVAGQCVVLNESLRMRACRCQQGDMLVLALTYLHDQRESRLPTKEGSLLF